MTTHRKCSSCKTDRKLDQYNKDSRTKSGYRYECKLCQYKSQARHLKKKIKQMEENYDDLRV